MAKNIRAMFGRPCRELYDRANARIGSAHPHDLFRMLGVCELAIQGVAAAKRYPLCQPDESVRWIHAGIFRVDGSKGKLRRTVGIEEAITKRKGTLEETKAAKASAEAANRAKSELFAGGRWCQV